MKRVLALITLAAVLFASACTATDSATVRTVDPATFLNQAAQPGTTVIDVRTPDEYSAGHVEGAVNIDVESPGFADALKRLDPAAAYQVYCHSGRRSSIAAEAMVDAGFTNVINLSGGIGDLQAAGAQLVAS